MHELSVAQALVDQVEDLANQHGAVGIHLIRVRVGPLAGVVPDLLATAFPLSAIGTRAEHARLELVEAPIAYKPVEPGATTISVLQGLLKKNDDQADHNRAHFDARGILAVNLMSSPGSGKTALLEATIEALKDEFKLAVIEGDLETENDAERIRAQGVPAHQIVTGTACHLDAHMVHDALHQMDLTGIDILFVENVGNLVCPASFDLGQHANVALLSTTEGDDKPAKYPVMFRGADAVVISKTDLLAVLDDFDPDQAETHIRHLANPAPVLRLSARKGEGMTAWLDWLRGQLKPQRARAAAAPHTVPLDQ